MIRLLPARPPAGDDDGLKSMVSGPGTQHALPCLGMHKRRRNWDD